MTRHDLAATFDSHLNRDKTYTGAQVAAMAGIAVLTMVESSCSMKRAVATTQGR